MAYVSQEKKAKIAAALKAVMPAGWKYSLAVNNHSTIVCTVAAAPVDILAMVEMRNHWRVNEYHVKNLPDKWLSETLGAILRALNTDNYDRSDVMTDYFDVGHYVDLQFGRWNKPFVCKA